MVFIVLNSDGTVNKCFADFASASSYAIDMDLKVSIFKLH